MEFTLTMEDLTRQLSKSKQSLYLLFNKNKTFINHNSIRKQRKIFYNQAVLDFLLDYYANGTPIEAENKPIEAPSREDGGEATQAQIKALQGKIDMLEAQLEAKDKQIQDLINQNNITLMLLSQEKQEKALFLPAPKKTIGERIKKLFKKD